MNKNCSRSFWVFLILAVVASGAPADLTAGLPKADQEMLDQHIPKAQDLVKTALERPMTYERAILELTQLIGLRREALIEINSRTPLTTFDGIETQDLYDLAAIQSLISITTAAAEADPTLPLREYHQHLANAMGTFPALGDHPVAFMVYGLVELTILGVDKLWQDSALSREESAKAAVALIHAGALIFDTSANETLFKSNAAGLRQSSVVARLRCPVDQGTYAISQMKNRVDEVGNITTIHYIACEVCQETMALDFPSIWRAASTGWQKNRG